jgi:NADH-quinone oxidoreductase subunit G
MAPALATKLGVIDGDAVRVTQGKGSALLPAAIDSRLPQNVIRVAAAHPSTSMLGGMFGEVRVEKA